MQEALTFLEKKEFAYNTETLFEPSKGGVPHFVILVYPYHPANLVPTFSHVLDSIQLIHEHSHDFVWPDLARDFHRYQE